MGQQQQVVFPPDGPIVAGSLPSVKTYSKCLFLGACKEQTARLEERPPQRKTTRRFSDELSRIANRDPLHDMTEQVKLNATVKK